MISSQGIRSAVNRVVNAIIVVIIIIIISSSSSSSKVAVLDSQSSQFTALELLHATQVRWLAKYTFNIYIYIYIA
jgi:hypothetical protein